PVSLIGSFAVMAAMGFSLNNLSLFGLVLAIGIVVDDAIVVVENVQRNIESGLAPLEASFKAMREVSGPIIAVALVLCAVFVPTAFVSGITGQFFRQFALTIAVSTILSAFNSLTLSPALSALLLRPRKKGGFEPLPWFTFVPVGAWLGHKIGLYLATPILIALGLQAGHHGEGAHGLTQAGLDVLKFWGPIAIGGGSAFLFWAVLGKPFNVFLGWTFRVFNQAFEWSTNAYTKAVSGLLKVS